MAFESHVNVFVNNQPHAGERDFCIVPSEQAAAKMRKAARAKCTG